MIKNNATLFHTGILQRMDEKSKKIAALENTMETIFQDLMDEGDKTYIVEDLEEEVKASPHIDFTTLRKQIYRLKETNSQLANEDSLPQNSVDELHEEVAPLQVDDTYCLMNIKP